MDQLSELEARVRGGGVLTPQEQLDLVAKLRVAEDVQWRVLSELALLADKLTRSRECMRAAFGALCALDLKKARALLMVSGA